MGSFHEALHLSHLPRGDRDTRRARRSQSRAASLSTGFSGTGMGLGLAMTGILGCTAVLLRTSSTLFTFGLYSGIVASVVFAGVLSIRGMFRLSSAHVGMDMSNRHLSRLPNLLPPERARRSRRRRPDRATLFPGHIATRPNRGLERDKLRRQRPIGPFFG